MADEVAKRDAHDFIVTAVEPAESAGRIAVTLTDARDGRVTLHLERVAAALLRDLLDDQLP